MEGWGKVQIFDKKMFQFSPDCNNRRALVKKSLLHEASDGGEHLLVPCPMGNR
jgi:hypothetical protein